MPSPSTIRTSRLALGLTQAQAGAVVGASARTWRAWESGWRVMPGAKWELWEIKTMGGGGEMSAQSLEDILDMHPSRQPKQYAIAHMGRINAILESSAPDSVKRQLLAVKSALTDDAQSYCSGLGKLVYCVDEWTKKYVTAAPTPSTSADSPPHPQDPQT